MLSFFKSICNCCPRAPRSRGIESSSDKTKFDVTAVALAVPVSNSRRKEKYNVQLLASEIERLKLEITRLNFETKQLKKEVFQQSQQKLQQQIEMNELRISLGQLHNESLRGMHSFPQDTRGTFFYLPSPPLTPPGSPLIETSKGNLTPDELQELQDLKALEAMMS